MSFDRDKFMTEQSFLFDGPHDWKIHGRKWRVDRPQGTLVGVHGYSEHSGRYSHLAEFLNSKSWDVFWVDLPGHGLSDGARNNIDDFQDYVTTIERFIREVERSGAKPPYQMFAHSLGGLVSLRFLQTSVLASTIQRIALSGPLLGLDRYPASLLFFLRFLISVLPNVRLDNDRELSGPFLTHDEGRMASRLADPLVNSHVTFHWFREFCKVQPQVFRDIEKIRIPVKMLVAEEERVVSKKEIFRFFDLLSGAKKELKVYPGMLHEIVNEVQRQLVFDDILQWLTERQ